MNCLLGKQIWHWIEAVIFGVWRWIAEGYQAVSEMLTPTNINVLQPCCKEKEIYTCKIQSRLEKPLGSGKYNLYILFLFYTIWQFVLVSRWISKVFYAKRKRQEKYRCSEQNFGNSPNLSNKNVSWEKRTIFYVTWSLSQLNKTGFRVRFTIK